MDPIICHKVVTKAQVVFHRPKTFPYNEVITGTVVRNKDGSNCAVMAAVAPNTYKSWHKKVRIVNGKKDKSGFKGPQEILFCYFVNQQTKDRLRMELRKANSVNDVDAFSRTICAELVCLAEPHIEFIRKSDPNWGSYNRVRKIVDLYLEHIVAVSDLFNEQERQQIIKYLFLPLDSAIFSSELLFSGSTSVALHTGLSRSSKVF